MTFGARWPIVLFPDAARHWPADALRRALVHEVEHVRRYDWPILLLARAACALYWFIPLSWIAFRRLRLEAERACDDAVVLGGDGPDYAAELVHLARCVARRREDLALTMAARSDLAARVSAVLDGAQRRGRAGTASLAGAAAAAVALAVLAIPIRAVGADAVAGVAIADTADKPGEPGQRRGGRLGGRALMEAAEADDIEGLRALIAAGADVNAAIGGDGSPLIEAARSASVDAVRLLLDAGADASMGVAGDGSPLIAAAARGRLDIVGLLLDRGARIDEIVPGDENALMQASAGGHLPLVQLLVQRGANVHLRAWSGSSYDRSGRGEWRTALGLARREGHEAVARYLVSRGARQ